MLSRRAKEAIKAGLAMAIAFGIALAMDWEKPNWAGLAVAMVSIRVCRRAPKQYWRVAMADVMAVAVINLLVIHFRWDALVLSMDGRMMGHALQDMTRWGLSGPVILLCGLLFLAFYAHDRTTRSK